MININGTNPEIMKEDLCKTCVNHWTDFPLPLDQAESHCTVVDEKFGFGKMNEVVPYPCLECPFNCYSERKTHYLLTNIY